MGVYRARLESEQAPTRRFRLLLYAALPDRVHGEIVSPVGTTELILDGGGGRLAVTLPRRRVAYVGSGDAAALEKVLGIRLSLEQLVQGLLGQDPDLAGYAMQREPEDRIGLPRALRIEGDGNRLTLRLKSEKPLRVSTETLGNGEPPPGVERRSLEQLRPVELTDEDLEGQSG